MWKHLNTWGQGTLSLWILVFDESFCCEPESSLDYSFMVIIWVWITAAGSRLFSLCLISTTLVFLRNGLGLALAVSIIFCLLLLFSQFQMHLHLSWFDQISDVHEAHISYCPNNTRIMMQDRRTAPEEKYLHLWKACQSNEYYEII